MAHTSSKKIDFTRQQLASIEEILEEVSRLNQFVRYLEFIVPDSGDVMAAQRSIEIAASVLTEAETETPCRYDTVLQKKMPRIHAVKDTKRRVIILGEEGSTEVGPNLHHWNHAEYLLFP